MTSRLYTNVFVSCSDSRYKSVLLPTSKMASDLGTRLCTMEVLLLYAIRLLISVVPLYTDGHPHPPSLMAPVDRKRIDGEISNIFFFPVTNSM